MPAAPRCFATVNAVVVEESRRAAASALVLPKGKAAESPKQSESSDALAHGPAFLIAVPGGLLSL